MESSVSLDPSPRTAVSELTHNVVIRRSYLGRPTGQKQSRPNRARVENEKYMHHAIFLFFFSRKTQIRRQDNLRAPATLRKNKRKPTTNCCFDVNSRPWFDIQSGSAFMYCFGTLRNSKRLSCCSSNPHGNFRIT